MPRGFERVSAMACAFFGLSHCADPIDAPSAFSAERYLCGPDDSAEFEALVEECRTLRETSLCGGVLSLRGNIDSEDVVIDTRVASAQPVDWPGEPTISREISLLAASPYFSMKLDVNYLAIPPATSISGLLPVNCAPQPAASHACMILNLEARGGNYFSEVTNVVREIELEAPPELRATFSGDLSRGGQIEGCFHLFVRNTL